MAMTAPLVAQYAKRLAIPIMKSRRYGRIVNLSSSMGSLTEMGAGYISSGYRDAMGFLLIIAVLLFKPTGLYARSERIG